MLGAMVDALKRYATDDAVGCVVLTGAGRGFCAGGDVKAMAAGNEMQAVGLEAKAQALRERMEVSRILHELPKPTIAMINGPAAGAGLSMALACDLRTMGAGVRISTAFANVGYSGDFGGSYFLSKLIGTGRARELYFLADRVDAATCLSLGIVNRVIADDALRDETRELSRRLAGGPRVALRYMKRNFNAAESGTLAECLNLEAWHHIRTGETDDHKEAARAFVEKRKPVFKGR
jgi:2-(1,2-epoxy-1,2-dihydrophenyl)acetyl-CoA isomerase